LTGKTFLSTQVSGHLQVPGTKVRLVFDHAMLAASAGCNTMSAEYSLDNSVLRWTGPARSTSIGCDPAGSAQDQWLTSFLEAGASATLSDDDLTLARGSTVIDLHAQ
jgi:heat shock protein HslJ